MSSKAAYSEADQNAHLLGKKLFAAKIRHEQDHYKAQYDTHLQSFLQRADKSLSRMFNSLSERDIVQLYYTESHHTKNITRIFPSHENGAAWINKDKACEELEANSSALAAFRDALNEAQLDVSLQIVDAPAKRKNQKPQYYFDMKIIGYHAYDL